MFHQSSSSTRLGTTTIESGVVFTLLTVTRSYSRSIEKSGSSTIRRYLRNEILRSCLSERSGNPSGATATPAGITPRKRPSGVSAQTISPCRASSRSESPGEMCKVSERSPPRPTNIGPSATATVR